jgi:hypothetical protein
MKLAERGVVTMSNELHQRSIERVSATLAAARNASWGRTEFYGFYIVLHPKRS